MKKATIFYNRHAGGTTHINPAWWAEDEEGHVIAGPGGTKGEVQRELASHNRLIRSGKWTPRPLYTGY